MPKPKKSKTKEHPIIQHRIYELEDRIDKLETNYAGMAECVARHDKFSKDLDYVNTQLAVANHLTQILKYEKEHDEHIEDWRKDEPGEVNLCETCFFYEAQQKFCAAKERTIDYMINECSEYEERNSKPEFKVGDRVEIIGGAGTIKDEREDYFTIVFDGIFMPYRYSKDYMRLNFRKLPAEEPWCAATALSRIKRGAEKPADEPEWSALNQLISTHEQIKKEQMWICPNKRDGWCESRTCLHSKEHKFISHDEAPYYHTECECVSKICPSCVPVDVAENLQNDRHVDHIGEPNKKEPTDEYPPKRETLDERIVSTRAHLIALSVACERDQKGYYADKQHELFAILSNQLLIMQTLKQLSHDNISVESDKPKEREPGWYVTRNRRCERYDCLYWTGTKWKFGPDEKNYGDADEKFVKSCWIGPRIEEPKE